MTGWTVILLVIAAGCAGKDSSARDLGLAEAIPEASARFDIGPLRDGGPACPSAFTPCGGDVLGKWSLVSVCPAGGASLTTPCDHPFASLPGCTGAENQATCTNVYGGAITLRSDGTSTVEMSLHAEMAITLSSACVLAVAGGSSAQAACPGLKTPNGKALECSFSSGLCRCAFKTEPQTETKNDVYQVSGTELVVTPNVGEKIGGAYCITGDELVMRGVIGWAYWVLRRTP